MKKISTTVLAVLSAIILFAQAPHAFKYQAVVRDGNGNILPFDNVALKLSIQEGQPGGQVIYWERHVATTNQFGSVNLEFGDGGVLSGGVWDSINWGNQNFYLGVELDTTGGINYTPMGSSQLVSVPYAMYAEDDGDWHILADTSQAKISPSYYLVTDERVAIGHTLSPPPYPDAYLHVGTANCQKSDLMQVGWHTDRRIRVDTFAKVKHRYFPPEVDDHAWEARGTTLDAMYYIENQEDSHVSSIGLEAQVTSNNANSHSCGVKGSNYGDGIGVFGKSYSDLGIGVRGLNTMSSNKGELGTFDYGVYGTHGVSQTEGMLGVDFYGVYGIEPDSSNVGALASTLFGAWGVHGNTGNTGYLGRRNAGVFGLHFYTGNTGYIGNTDHGVFGWYSAKGMYGYLGDDSCGVGGVLGHTYVVGDCGVHGFGGSEQANPGWGYGLSGTICGTKGSNQVDNSYWFGTSGHTSHNQNRTGGVLGADNAGTVWGILGYRNSSGNYFGSYCCGAFPPGIGGGKDSKPKTNIGLGSWGDLFGADIHGKIYGTYSEGDRYAMFSNGKVFKNDLDVHLQKNQNEQNIVLYTNVSTDPTVQTSGYANLSEGSCSVSFNNSFAGAVSSSEPIIVAVTPFGNSNGVYLSNVTNDGFTLTENNGGKSDVMVSYIAIGKRAGYEKPDIPQEVIASDYVDILSRGLHNDADTETDGEGLYFKDGKVYNGSFK